MTDKAIGRLLHEAHLHYQRQQGIRDLGKNKSLRFVEPTSDKWIEQHRRWRPEGFYRLHCSHDRPRWMPCGQCKRGVKEARNNWTLLLTGKL